MKERQGEHSDNHQICWLKDPAVIWEGLGETEGAYWEIAHDSSDVVGRQELSTYCWLSYQSVLALVSQIVQLLRDRIRRVLSESHEDLLQSNPESASQLLGIPIAIAIPQGPWLPITVAAVHALNVPSSCGSLSFYAILIPLDPADGRRRLSAMLADARPLFVLVAADCDLANMKVAVTDMLEVYQETNPIEGLFRAKQPEIVSMHTLLTDCSKSVSEEALCRLHEQVADPDSSLLDWIAACDESHDPTPPSIPNRISHIVYTSGTTGTPKGCISSAQSLAHYLAAKNRAHGISEKSTVLLASAIAFDPCFSDVLATFTARARLALCSRAQLHQSLATVLTHLKVTHCLCTPTLWATVPVQASLPSLEVVALGGEAISDRQVQTWTCRGTTRHGSLQFCATYGVTEACVYQTMGRLTSTKESHRGLPGQDVGLPFEGLGVRICQARDESAADNLMLVQGTGYPAGVGEVVLTGKQLDEWSSYLGGPSDKQASFGFSKSDGFYYRTGDRGYMSPDTGHLHILGRIQGQDGMVKFNGIRVELGELESALIDDAHIHDSEQESVVADAMVVAIQPEESSSAAELIAYLVLSPRVLVEIGLPPTVPEKGVLCTPGPFLTLVRERTRVKARVTPSSFVIIPRIPLSRTGKRYREGVPNLEETVPQRQGDEGGSSVNLWECGRVGSIVADSIVDCLNLQPCQSCLLTRSATFATLGGDSLAAVRVVRALYAAHHHVQDNRHLGGEYGVLEGPFAVSHLLGAMNLGLYVDWLKNKKVCADVSDVSTNETNQTETPVALEAGALSSTASQLYDALLQTCTQQHTSIAMALLDIGADPNGGAHDGRLGKTSGRRERKNIFRSSPLHLACASGEPRLVQKLLQCKAKFNSPDASGLFPIHHASGGTSTVYSIEDDSRRLECVKLLLDSGVPLRMKDGNRHSVLHTAARAGNALVLQYVMQRWKIVCDKDWSRSFEWRDRWSRTPVHWAVLNGKVEALRVLLEMGCRPDPVTPKSNRDTSAALESPLEMCDRLYGDSGNMIRKLLLDAREHPVKVA